MLSVHNLTYHYRKDLSAALEDVSLEIPTGAITAVVGMSGSGKTTLLNILGLLADGKRKPETVVWHDGAERHDFAALGPYRQAHFRREHFGFVFQQAHLLPYFSNRQNIQLPLTLEGLPKEHRDRTLDTLLDAVRQAREELLEQMKKPPRRVAGGQRQRMAILRAVIHDPQIVFADEPFANLDPVNRDSIVKLLKDWQAGLLNPASKDRERTLVVVTHDIDVACNDFAKHFVLLRRGRVVRGGVLPREELPGGIKEIERLIQPQTGEDTPEADVASSDTQHSPDRAKGRPLHGRASMKPCDLVKFALQDLFRWGAWRITLANCLTILIVCALTLAAYGLALGSRRVGILRLERDPATLRLEVGDSVYKGSINEQVMIRLEQEILRSISDRSAYLGGAPFRVPELGWHRQDQRGIRPLKGRTIRLEAGQRDPLLKSLPLRPGGRGFLGPDDEGVIITPSMLAELALDPGAASPASLTLDVRGRPQTVPVLGITTTDLPGPLYFVIPEKYEQKLTVGQPDPRLKYVYTGPLPSDWPKPDQFTDQIAHLFESWRMDVHEDTVGGQRIFYLRSQSLLDDPDHPCPTWSEWRRCATRFHEQMVASGYEQGPEFLDLDHRGQVPDEEVEQVLTFDMAAFYFSNVNELKPAADACERVKGVHPPNRDAIDRLQGLDRQTQAAIRILSVFEGVIVLMACWNLIVIQVIRAAQKVTEAGMLKAIGASNWLLRKIVWAEAVIIWAPASFLGIVLGGLGGMAMARHWYADPEEAWVGFVWSAVTAGLVFVASLAVCILSSWWATRSWRSSGPAKLLIDD